MLKLTNLKLLLLGAVVSGTLFAASATAQNLPANILWQENFQEYENNEVLATPGTFSDTSTRWVLRNGNSANWTNANAGLKAVVSGGNTYGSLYSPYITPAPDSNFTRILTRGSEFGTVAYDHSANLLFGGDVQPTTFQNTAVSTETRLVFNGSGIVKSTGATAGFSVSFIIAADGQFSVSYGGMGETAANSGTVVANLGSWYSFAAEVDKDTDIITVSVYDRDAVGDNLVWSTSTQGLFSITSFSGLSLDARHNRPGDRIAGFDNLYIGTTAIPEPSTTAALMLLGVGALVVYKRRRRG